ncbi:MAG: SAM-dependent methyltransferase [Solirubrobacteraceae bacterium]|nr:SAM-dependent methyltransferase [Solirubrobacteraceae bacterium]
MTDPDLLGDHERRYRADPDPWNQRTSAYERAKRAATIAACGPAPRRRALELGAGNAVLAKAIAPLADELVAVEGVPAAAALARVRLEPVVGARVVEGLIPQGVPAGPYDLVIASEILTLLDEPSYRMTLRLLRGWLDVDARVVAVHRTEPHTRQARSAEVVHADLAGQGFLSRVAGNGSTGADYRLDVFERSV